MAGEDEIDDLQDQKDGRFYENTLADEGGTGQLAGYGDSYIDELTDTDERPAKQSVQQGNDASSEFANFGGKAYDDAFDMVDRDDEADDDDNFDGEDEDFDNDAEDFDGDDDEPGSKFGSMLRYGGADDDDDEEQDDEDEEDEDENDENDDEDGEGGGKGKKGKKDKNQKGKGNGADKGQFTKVKRRKISPEERAAMKAKKDEIFAKELGVKFIWHEGEEITLETLQQYWSLFAKHVTEVSELMKAADQAVESLLQATTFGPNLILKANKVLGKLGKDTNSGMIQSLLNLIATPLITLIWIVASIIYSFVFMQFMELVTIAGVKTALKGIIKLAQGPLQKVFSMGMKKLKKKFNYKGIVVAPK